MERCACRFLVVCRPLHASSLCTIGKTYRNMAFIAVLGLLFSLPRFFEYEIDLENRFKFKLTSLLQSRLYTIIYRIVLFFLIMYLLPLALLIILNYKLLRALRRAASYRATLMHTSRQSSGQKNNKNNRSISIIVILVVSICILCNTCAMMSHLLWSLVECYKESGQFAHLDIYRRHLSLISNIFVTFNSAVNFTIYCVCSHNFRQTLARTCVVCKMREHKPRHRWTSSRSSSTLTAGNATYISLLSQNVSSKQDGKSFIEM